MCSREWLRVKVGTSPKPSEFGALQCGMDDRAVLWKSQLHQASEPSRLLIYTTWPPVVYFKPGPLYRFYFLSRCYMTVKIVTDSCSDIPKEEAKQLGISVVPVYVRFGDEVYRDGVDI